MSRRRLSYRATNVQIFTTGGHGGTEGHREFYHRAGVSAGDTQSAIYPFPRWKSAATSSSLDSSKTLTVIRSGYRMTQRVVTMRLIVKHLF